MEPLRARMEERKADLTSYLTSGGPKDFVEYVKAVSKLQIVQMTLDDIAEIETRYIED
jgi:hypothetical protein